MRRLPHRGLVVLCALATSSVATPVAAFELGDLFRTPGQRAAARLEAGEHEALVEDAPDAAWEGVGRYAGGDASGAAEAFARALDADGTTATERDTLLYNRATAETRAGRLDDAIALYDALLARDPDHEDAAHNRDVARALQALEDQESPSSGESDGEEGEGQEGEERGQGGEPGADGESGSEESDGESSREEGARDGEDEDATGEPGAEEAGDANGDDDGAADALDETAAAEARAAARAALEAERARAGPDGEDAERDDALAADGTRTPTEREQATEQWLRRIADDPSGLLRRRLERSHRGDYPEVGDGDEPW